MVKAPILAIVLALVGACAPHAGQPSLRDAFSSYAYSRLRATPDPTNRFADDPRAATLGQKLFFDTRFSGPLLDEANDGSGGTLGRRGETGKVACASCHVPERGVFADTRSPRRQLSLASGWTRRRAPSLLDVGHVTFLMWDGRHDSFFNQVFVPVESPLELNSSRLFVAQSLARHYRDEYESVFGPLPSLGGYPELEADAAGCGAFPPDPARDVCEKPGRGDATLTRVVVNFGKAIEAYLRRLSCGPGRFDAWLAGDDAALAADEQAGAALFAGKAGCSRCHQGPLFTDHQFHNIGLAGELIPFTGVNSAGDLGVAAGFPKLHADPLNSKSAFSDGYDGRLERAPSVAAGAFRTPSLRCVGRRPSFMHDGRFRSLRDAVRFFVDGGARGGFPGSSEIEPLGLGKAEARQLEAFLRALDGPGPAPALLVAP
ncbi:MAG TPA: cytochrome c peroxidase [Polyangiaceae bacterium]